MWSKIKSLIIKILKIFTFSKTTNLINNSKDLEDIEKYQVSSISRKATKQINAKTITIKIYNSLIGYSLEKVNIYLNGLLVCWNQKITNELYFYKAITFSEELENIGLKFDLVCNDGEIIKDLNFLKDVNDEYISIIINDKILGLLPITFDATVAEIEK